MKKGVLFEDKQILIPWFTPYNLLYKYKEKRIDKGDGTLWYLGRRTVLDGYQCHIQVIKWLDQPTSKPIKRVFADLGTDIEGHKQFQWLKSHLTNLLGEPNNIHLEKFNYLDIGNISWINEQIEISLIGYERFACWYSLNIGIIDKTN